MEEEKKVTPEFAGIRCGNDMGGVLDRDFSDGLKLWEG